MAEESVVVLKFRPKKAGNRLEEKTGMTGGGVRRSRLRSQKRSRLRREEVDRKDSGNETIQAAGHKSSGGMKHLAAETCDRESAVLAVHWSTSEVEAHIAHWDRRRFALREEPEAKWRISRKESQKYTFCFGKKRRTVNRSRIRDPYVRFCERDKTGTINLSYPTRLFLKGELFVHVLFQIHLVLA